MVFFINKMMTYTYSNGRTQTVCDFNNNFTCVSCCAAGLVHYNWCLGSKPGYCDTMAYVETSEQESSSRPLQLRDGHPVYVSVQVRLWVIAPLGRSGDANTSRYIATRLHTFGAHKISTCLRGTHEKCVEFGMLPSFCLT